MIPFLKYGVIVLAVVLLFVLLCGFWAMISGNPAGMPIIFISSLIYIECMTVTWYLYQGKVRSNQ